jgi:hypothetical protein
MIIYYDPADGNTSLLVTQPTTFTSVVFFDARKKEISGVLS